MNIPDIQGIAIPDWLLGISVVFLVTGLSSYIFSNIINRLRVKVKQSSNIWNDALVEGGRRPIRVLIWVFGLIWMLDIIKQEFTSPLLMNIDQFRTVGNYSASSD